MKLEKHIKEIKALGELLVPYSFPMVPPEEEIDVNFIKSRQFDVDGYGVIVYYNKSNWEEYYLESLQVISLYGIFLPFYLICKIGKQFLGDQHLSLVEFYQDGKKIYCWTLMKDKNNNPCQNQFNKDVKNRSYEGLEFNSVTLDKINFY